MGVSDSLIKEKICSKTFGLEVCYVCASYRKVNLKHAGPFFKNNKLLQSAWVLDGLQPGGQDLSSYRPTISNDKLR